MKNRRLLLAAISLLVLIIAFLGALAINKASETQKSERQAGTPALDASQDPETKAVNSFPDSKLDSQKVATAASGSPSAPQPSQAVPTTSLSDQNQQELLEMLNAYRDQPDAEALSALISFLDHENPIVANEAINVLGYLAYKTDKRDEILQILQSKAVDSTYPFRNQALYMAAMIGKDEVLPTVSGYLETSADDPENDYDAASRALATIRSPACLPLLDRLLRQTSNPAIRINCFNTLAYIGTPEARQLLEEKITDAQEEDQMPAMIALARFKDPDATDFLVETVENAQLSKETLAALAVSQSAPDIFGRLLKSYTAAEAQKIDWLDLLAEHSVEGNSQLRADMTTLMAELIETSDSVALKLRAMNVIGELGDPDAPIIMEPYLQSDNSAIRKSAFSNFVKFADPINYVVLFDFLWEEDQDMRRTAMTALEPFVLSDDVKLLEKAAQHPDEFISSRAKSLLKQFKS